MTGSMRELVALRFLQGIAMSSGPVVARSIVRDLYVREQAAARQAELLGYLERLQRDLAEMTRTVRDLG